MLNSLCIRSNLLNNIFVTRNAPFCNTVKTWTFLQRSLLIPHKGIVRKEFTIHKGILAHFLEQNLADFLLLIVIMVRLPRRPMAPCWRQLTPLHGICHISHTRPPRWEATGWARSLATWEEVLCPTHPLITAQTPVLTLRLSFLPLPGQEWPPRPVFKSRLNV